MHPLTRTFAYTMMIAAIYVAAACQQKQDLTNGTASVTAPTTVAEITSIKPEPKPASAAAPPPAAALVAAAPGVASRIDEDTAKINDPNAQAFTPGGSSLTGLVSTTSDTYIAVGDQALLLKGTAMVKIPTVDLKVSGNSVAIEIGADETTEFALIVTNNVGNASSGWPDDALCLVLRGEQAGREFVSLSSESGCWSTSTQLSKALDPICTANICSFSIPRAVLVSIAAKRSLVQIIGRPVAPAANAGAGSTSATTASPASASPAPASQVSPAPADPAPASPVPASSSPTLVMADKVPGIASEGVASAELAPVAAVVASAVAASQASDAAMNDRMVVQVPPPAMIAAVLTIDPPVEDDLRSLPLVLPLEVIEATPEVQDPVQTPVATAKPSLPPPATTGSDPALPSISTTASSPEPLPALVPKAPATKTTEVGAKKRQARAARREAAAYLVGKQAYEEKHRERDDLRKKRKKFRDTVLAEQIKATNNYCVDRINAAQRSGKRAKIEAAKSACLESKERLEKLKDQDKSLTTELAEQLVELNKAKKLAGVQLQAYAKKIKQSSHAPAPESARHKP